MKKLILALSCSVFTLAACSQNKDEPEVVTDTTNQTEAPSVKKVTIPATDQLGSFETPVNGLALYSHGKEAVKSGIIATNGDNGLFLIGLDGSLKSSYEGAFNQTVSTTYIEGSNGDTLSLILSYNDKSNALEVLTVDEETGILESLAADTALTTSPNCVARNPSSLDAYAVFIDDNNIKTAKLSMMEGELEISSVADEPNSESFSHCFTDDRIGLVYLRSSNGMLKSFDAASSEIELSSVNIEKIPTENPNITFSSLMYGDSGAGYIMSVNQNDGYELFVQDIEKGSIKGVFSIGEFSDIAEVVSISAFTAEAGNFGGLYRNGVIAVIEGQESYAFKLAPWSAAASALDIEISPIRTRRFLTPEIEDDERIPINFSINLPTGEE